MLVLIGIFYIALVLALVFGINALIVWVLCWCLKAIGIVSIFGWTVAFSWPLVVVFMIISSIFSRNVVKVKTN